MTLLRLKELQSDFREFLQYGRHEDAILKALRAPGAIQGAHRLDVYRNAYFIRLEKSLGHDFPLTETVLGQAGFARLAGEFVQVNPSRHPSIRYVGGGFPAWLREHSRPAAGDLAAIEWAAMQVFDGPDIVAADVSCLDGLPPEDWARMSISLAPTLSLLLLNSNADRVWLAKAEKVKLAESSPGHIAISRDAQSRPSLAIIDSASFAVLIAIKANSRLAEANEHLACNQDADDLPARVAQALHIAFANGWIAGVNLNTQEHSL